MKLSICPSNSFIHILLMLRDHEVRNACPPLDVFKLLVLTENIPLKYPSLGTCPKPTRFKLAFPESLLQDLETPHPSLILRSTIIVRLVRIVRLFRRENVGCA